MSRRHIITGAVLLGLSALVSRILGVFRDHFFAVKFGALHGEGMYDLDVYFAAFRIPDFLYNLLILGTISVAFVPIFTGYLVDGKRKEGFEFVNSILHLIVFIMALLAIVVSFFAPWILPWIVPGFSPEELALTVRVTRLLLFSPIFFGLSSVAQSLQTSFQTFFYYSLSPIVYNVSIILGTILFSERYGVYGVAFGVVIGAFLHFLVQVPALWKLGYRYAPICHFRHPDVRKMLWLTGPRLIGVSAMQFMLMVDTFLASSLSQGSLTIFNLALNLEAVPLGMVALSLSVSSFARLSEIAKKMDKKKFVSELSSLLQWILFLIIPATVGMYLLRNDITEFILLGGRFTLSDVRITAITLQFLLLGLIFQSMTQLLARAFYAWHDTKTPVQMVIVTVIIHIFLSFLFVDLYGLIGLALAYSFAELCNCILLVFAAARRFGSFREFFPVYASMNSIFSTLVMGIFLFFFERYLQKFLDGLPILMILIFSAFGVYLCAYWLFLKVFPQKSRVRMNESHLL